MVILVVVSLRLKILGQANLQIRTIIVVSMACDDRMGGYDARGRL